MLDDTHEFLTRNYPAQRTHRSKLLTLEQLYLVSQIIAAAAIVASLVFVGMQIRQNTGQSKITSSQAIDTSNMLAADPIYIPENSAIWTKGHATPELLTDHERHMFGMLMTRLFGASFNTSVYQHSRGAYDKEIFGMLVLYFQSLISTPGGSKWYAENRYILLPATQEVLDCKKEPSKMVTKPTENAA